MSCQSWPEFGCHTGLPWREQFRAQQITLLIISITALVLFLQICKFESGRFSQRFSALNKQALVGSTSFQNEDSKKQAHSFGKSNLLKRAEHLRYFWSIFIASRRQHSQESFHGQMFSFSSCWNIFGRPISQDNITGHRGYTLTFAGRGWFGSQIGLPGQKSARRWVLWHL